MWRIVVSEEGQVTLPELAVDARTFVIGSGSDARVRLPAAAAAAEHVRIDGAQWTTLVATTIDGTPRAAGSAGELGDGVELALGDYRVHVGPAPAGTSASPPQRTESLARELVRGLLGSGAAPTLEVERGPVVGVKRVLPPPVSTVTIGRGEEAQWIVLDEDLSRTHAELRRGWDGVTIRDLGSKNGTRVDGVVVDDAGVPVRDGQMIELGKVVLRYRDPAERHLRGEPAANTPTGESTLAATPRAVRVASSPGTPPVSDAKSWPWASMIAAVIACLSIATLVWILAG